MRTADLPKIGIIENYQSGDTFGRWADLRGRDVLCLGMSEEQTDEFVARHSPNSITLLAYWSDHVDTKVSRYPLIMGDITQRTDFCDKQFDVTLSLSVLEHVSDVPAALREMARVTRGDMIHLFGPAWSCAYGHHLYLDPTDPNLNFVAWQMPAHMHLLCNEAEVVDYYIELGYGRHVGQAVFHQFHGSELINRINYSEYTRAFDEFQLVRSEMMFNLLPAEHIAALRSAFPKIRDFSTYGGLCQLRC